MRDDRGAVYLMAIPMVCLLIGMVWYVKAIGDVIIDREALQDAADSGALSAAIMHARGMNMIALVNQVMAALVAVLVTLKMFETLMLLAQGLAVLLSVPTYGASMSVVPPAKTAENASKSAYNGLKEVITPAVQGLHYFELGLKYSMPGAAQLRVIESVEHFTPPAAFGFAIPGAYPLPVEKGTWSDL
ncbi:MAG: pilus assembly protein TadG-related protein, partial [Myxococcales bacterium]|nr:pilus assembly protein TadG-related protein [Myxococcales bacterium]